MNQFVTTCHYVPPKKKSFIQIISKRKEYPSPKHFNYMEIIIL